MSTVKEVIKRLRQYHDLNEQIAVHIWCADDVKGLAEEQGRPLTDQQADNAIFYIENHIDCELGITWTTVNCAIDLQLESADDED